MITMKLRSPLLCCLPPSPAASPFILRSLTTFSVSQTNHNNAQLLHLLRTFTPSSSSSSSRCCCSRIVRSSSTSGRDGAEDSFLDDHLIGRVSCLKDASEVLSVLGEELGRECGVLCASDCCRIIASALKRHNSDLAYVYFFRNAVELRSRFYGEWKTCGKMEMAQARCEHLYLIGSWTFSFIASVRCFQNTRCHLLHGRFFAGRGQRFNL